MSQDAEVALAEGETATRSSPCRRSPTPPEETEKTKTTLPACARLDLTEQGETAAAAAAAEGGRDPTFWGSTVFGFNYSSIGCVARTRPGLGDTQPRLPILAQYSTVNCW